MPNNRRGFNREIPNSAIEKIRVDAHLKKLETRLRTASAEGNITNAKIIKRHIIQLHLDRASAQKIGMGHNQNQTQIDVRIAQLKKDLQELKWL